MNIKEKFLQLTQFTTPYGHEQELRPLLPSFLKQDKWGNYYHKIGTGSTTLFTSHLDNYCVEKEKVNHIIEGNLIKTDGTTILGADNKAGVCVLLYLIEKNVPGLYYFFLGEEPIGSGGGLWGSSQIFNDLQILSGIERAVAFDRKAYGSVITRQMAQNCCSDEFADALCGAFSSKGIPMKKDPTGYYTDTGNFIEVIPECTNISVGVFNEHHNTEYVDLEYVEKIAKAASTIDWESLPTTRTPKWDIDEEETIIKRYKGFKTSKKDKKLFKQICEELDEKNYMLMNRTEFASGKEMVFNHWFSDKQIRIVVDNGEIFANGKKLQ